MGKKVKFSLRLCIVSEWDELTFPIAAVIVLQPVSAARKVLKTHKCFDCC